MLALRRAPEQHARRLDGFDGDRAVAFLEHDKLACDVLAADACTPSIDECPSDGAIKE